MTGTHIKGNRMDCLVLPCVPVTLLCVRCSYVIKTYNVLLHLFYKHITCKYINSLNHTASLILPGVLPQCLSRAVTNLHIEAELLCSQHYIIDVVMWCDISNQSNLNFLSSSCHVSSSAVRNHQWNKTEELVS